MHVCIWVSLSGKVTPWIVKKTKFFYGVTRKSVWLITPHIPWVILMHCGISAQWLLQYHAHYPHQTVNIGENNCTRTKWNYSAAGSLFWYVSMSTRLWRHPNVGSCLIVHLNYSRPGLFHSLSDSPKLFPDSLLFIFTLFLAFCPATAAPSINVLPDCIPLIPTCFLWLEEQWALLAAKLHLGVLKFSQAFCRKFRFFCVFCVIAGNSQAH